MKEKEGEGRGAEARGPLGSLHLASRSLFPARHSRCVPPLSLPGAMLSMGFGFVEYRKPEQAQKALKQLQVRPGCSAEVHAGTGGAVGRTGWGRQPSGIKLECG